MKLEDLTPEQQAKHIDVANPGQLRELLVSFAKRIQSLEGRPHGPVEKIMETFKGKKKHAEEEHEG